MAVPTPRMSSVCFAALLAASAGCSSDPDPDDSGGDDANDGSDGADDDGPGDDDDDGVEGTYTVEWGPVMLQPGEEDTQCVRKRLPTDRPVKIGQIVNDLGLASHHMIVYRLADGEETPSPEPCQPFVEVLDPSKGSPMAVTQRAEETISLPRGVGITLEPGQLIRIELHFFNATDDPIELRASSTFIELPEADFEHEADFLFIGNPEILLPGTPAGGIPEPVTQGPSYLPLPANLSGINVFAITGHQHQWGTDVQVSIATDEDDAGTSIYAPENFQWDEPETVYHDPPLTMPEGGGFRFSCTWENGSTEDVGFGESVDDEMCFFWAYYYPSRGAKICFHTDVIGNGVDLCCPENPLCEYIPAFLGQ
jgi:hypothetical protein